MDIFVSDHSHLQLRTLSHGDYSRVGAFVFYDAGQSERCIASERFPQRTKKYSGCALADCEGPGVMEGD